MRTSVVACFALVTLSLTCAIPAHAVGTRHRVQAATQAGLFALLREGGEAGEQVSAHRLESPCGSAPCARPQSSDVSLSSVVASCSVRFGPVAHRD